MSSKIQGGSVQTGTLSLQQNNPSRIETEAKPVPVEDAKSATLQEVTGSPEPLRLDQATPFQEQFGPQFGGGKEQTPAKIDPQLQNQLKQGIFADGLLASRDLKKATVSNAQQNSPAVQAAPFAPAPFTPAQFAATQFDAKPASVKPAAEPAASPSVTTPDTALTPSVTTPIAKVASSVATPNAAVAPSSSQPAANIVATPAATPAPTIATPQAENVATPAFAAQPTAATPDAIAQQVATPLASSPQAENVATPAVAAQPTATTPATPEVATPLAAAPEALATPLAEAAHAMISPLAEATPAAMPFAGGLDIGTPSVAEVQKPVVTSVETITTELGTELVQGFDGFHSFATAPVGELPRFSLPGGSRIEFKDPFQFDIFREGGLSDSFRMFDNSVHMFQPEGPEISKPMPMSLIFDDGTKFSVVEGPHVSVTHGKKFAAISDGKITQNNKSHAEESTKLFLTERKNVPPAQADAIIKQANGDVTGILAQHGERPKDVISFNSADLDRAYQDGAQVALNKDKQWVDAKDAQGNVAPGLSTEAQKALEEAKYQDALREKEFYNFMTQQTINKIIESGREYTQSLWEEESD